jgi:CRISPR-associated endoribonuclease Cas6
MPSRWLIRLWVDEPELVSPDYLHAVVCKWLEREDGAHTSNRKPFSISPLRPLEGGEVGFEVGLLDDDLVGRLAAGVRVAGRLGIRLGRQHASVGGVAHSLVRLEGPVPWERLLGRSVAASSFTFWFLTPTVFRSGGRGQPFPLPSLVFGHLRDRWQAFGPDGSLPRVAFAQAGLEVRAFDCQSRTFTRGGRELVGATGVAEFAAPGASAAERAALDALGRLAPFAGVGANTTVGMGVTRYRANGGTPYAPAVMPVTAEAMVTAEPGEQGRDAQAVGVPG